MFSTLENSKKWLLRLPSWLFALVLVLYWRLHPHRPKVWVFPGRGRWLLRWRGYTSALTRPQALIAGDPPFQQDTRYFGIEPGEVVLDVGACRGDFSIPAARRVGKKGRVIAVEPEPQNLLFLRKAAAGLGNVRIVAKCAWRRAGRVRLNLSGSPGEHSVMRLGPQPVGSIEVEADTLDHMLEELRIKRVDFMKVDVEGAELEVLEGAREVLKRTRKVVVECHRLGRYLTWPFVRDLLEDAGFQTYVEDETVYAWRGEKPGKSESLLTIPSRSFLLRGSYGGSSCL